MSSKKAYANGIYIPWYGYLFLFLTYASTFIVLTPLSLISGLFTSAEMGIVFANPLVNIGVVLFLIIAAAMVFIERKVIKSYDGTPDGAVKTNARLKLLATANIIIPVVSMLLLSFIILAAIQNSDSVLESFQGMKPTIFIIAMFEGSLLDVGLLFYILQIKIIESHLTVIPFDKKGMKSIDKMGRRG